MFDVCIQMLFLSVCVKVKCELYVRGFFLIYAHIHIPTVVYVHKSANVYANVYALLCTGFRV